MKSKKKKKKKIRKKHLHKKKAEKKLKNENKKNELLQKIKIYSKSIQNHVNTITTKIKTNTCIDINQHKNNNYNKNITYEFNIDENKKDNDNRSSRKIILLPTIEQKEKLLNWMEASQIMANNTIRLIKLISNAKRTSSKKVIKKSGNNPENIENKEKIKKKKTKNKKTTLDKNIENKVKIKKKRTKNKEATLDKNITIDYSNENISFYNFRDKLLWHIKKDLIKKYGIKCHVLDYVIKYTISNYVSCITNLKNGNIKHFRLRYFGKNNKRHILDIEKTSMKEHTFHKTDFGDIIKNKSNVKYNDLRCDCRIQYDSKRNEFYLYSSKKIENKISIIDRNKYISIDPGLRTYLTGMTQDSIVEIGTTFSDQLKKKIEKLDKINNNPKIPDNIKKKNERIINKKIKGIVDESHWKAIKYLTDNYGTIIIGNMSTKSIVNNKTSNLNRMNKIIIQRICFYKFLQRLQYKCGILGKELLITNEMYTSKLCSNCGWEHDNLGSNKVFKCKECKIKMDRDVNGSKNILMKNINKVVMVVNKKETKKTIKTITKVSKKKVIKKISNNY